MRLSHINTLLLIAIVIINGYILVLPVLPALFGPGANEQAYARTLQPSRHNNRDKVPHEYTIIIPSISLRETVHQGHDSTTLRQGIWHRPGTGSPEKGGNTVLAGHRFTYTNPRGPFYHLDLVQPDDMIGVIWGHITYRYRVKEIKTVHASETSVEDQSADSRLTLYTCTPLWFPKDRLVIIAARTEEP